jgi:hypothetical protein
MLDRPSTPDAPSAPSADVTRTLVDSVGVRWTIYEIVPEQVLARFIALLPHRERRGGWLLFEAEDGERRRLAPYPPEWRTMSSFELERWCMRAARVKDLPQRRASDRDPGSRWP